MNLAVHQSRAGLRFERAGIACADVDLSLHTIVVIGGRGIRREFALSCRGLEDATRSIALLCRVARRRAARRSLETLTAPAPHRTCLQEGLFSIAPALVLDEQSLPTELVTRALLERATAVAREVLPEIELIQAAVNRERPTPLPLSATVLGAPFLANDILRFRPAAVAVAMLETLPWATTTPACLDSLRPRLAAWRTLFSATGAASRAVNKTLGELGDIAAARDLWALQLVALERPVASLLHLRLLSERARLADDGPRADTRQAQLSLIQRATEPELAELVDLVARRFRRGGSPPAEQEHLFAELLAGAEPQRSAAPASPRCGAPTLGSIVRNAVDPRGLCRRRRDPVGATLPPPPLPLPVDEPLIFLSTTEALIHEGEDMEHCVAGRMNAALRGEAFLFHYVGGDGGATIEVTAAGVVRESKGRRNEHTASARTAERLLRSWGAGFWAARVGGAAGMECPTWDEPGPLVPLGMKPLETVGSCLEAFRLIVKNTAQPKFAVAAWFEEHAAVAVGRRRWLLANTNPDTPAVIAVDHRGEIIDRCGSTE
ncbi:MAG: hypothetical protein Q8O67_31645 [Deltaproteobacteria bacterium]|nr:hypothetical protein [Deltaproteobacteria bacterium]